MRKGKSIQELAKSWIGFNETKEALEGTGKELLAALKRANLDGVVIGSTALIAMPNLFDYEIRHLQQYEVIIAGLDERAKGGPPGCA